MDENPVETQYIDGKPYSPATARSNVWDLRKSYASPPPSAVPLPKVRPEQENALTAPRSSRSHGYVRENREAPAPSVSRASSRSPVSARAESRREPSRSFEESSGGSQPARMPVSVLSILVYALILIAVVVVTFMALAYWQARTGALYIEPGPDAGAAAAMFDYAAEGMSSQSDVSIPDMFAAVEEDFPLEVTQFFSVTPYTVRRGDTVSSLAVRNNVSMDAIVSLNGISNARSLQEGRVLKIPNMDGVAYTVRASDRSYQQIAESFGVPLSVVLDANDVQNEIMNPGDIIFIPGAQLKREDLNMAVGDYFMWPLKDRQILNKYSWVDSPLTGIEEPGKVRHEGIDLGARSGTAVRAAMDGTVIKAGANALYGKYIIIQHTNGFETLYGNLNAYSVKENTFVYQGTKIAESGGVGHAKSPCLHFGVYRNSKSVNPLDYLAK